MVADEVVLELEHQVALAARLPGGDDEAKQRRLRQIDPVLARIEAPDQLFARRGPLRLQLDLDDSQRRLPPYHLRRRRLPLPYKRRAQDVVSIHHLLHRSEIAIQKRPLREDHLTDHEIRVALAGQQVMKQDAFL